MIRTILDSNFAILAIKNYSLPGKSTLFYCLLAIMDSLGVLFCKLCANIFQFCSSPGVVHFIYNLDMAKLVLLLLVTVLDTQYFEW